jgi:hypothetical protein
MVEFRPRWSGVRAVVTTCFILWGLGGLGISVFAGLGAPILTAIYVTLMWMAGVMFFGLALISDVSYHLAGDALPVYVVEKPRPGEA